MKENNYGPYPVKQYKEVRLRDFSLGLDDNLKRVDDNFRAHCWIPTKDKVALISSVAYAVTEQGKPIMFEPGMGSGLIGQIFSDIGLDYFGMDYRQEQIDAIVSSGTIPEERMFQGDIEEPDEIKKKMGNPVIDLLYNSFMPRDENWTPCLSHLNPKAMILVYHPTHCGTEKSFSEIAGYTLMEFTDKKKTMLTPALPVILPNDITNAVRYGDPLNTNTGGLMQIYVREDVMKKAQEEEGFSVPERIGRNMGMILQRMMEEGISLPWESELEMLNTRRKPNESIDAIMKD